MDIDRKTHDRGTSIVIRPECGGLIQVHKQPSDYIGPVVNQMSIMITWTSSRDTKSSLLAAEQFAAALAEAIAQAKRLEDEHG